MLKLSSNAIGMLTAKYRSVLTKLVFKNAVICITAGLVFCASPVEAGSYIVDDSPYRTLDAVWQRTDSQDENTITDMQLQGSRNLTSNETIQANNNATKYTIVINWKLTLNGNLVKSDKTATLLANTDNDYVNGTIIINNGILGITAKEYANDPANVLAIGAVENNTQLNFVSSAGGFYQKNITISDYSGSGILGLEASLKDANNTWSDYVTFNAFNNNGGSTPIFFIFEDGSDVINMPAGGLLFATINPTGSSDSFVLHSESSTLGAYTLSIKTDDNINYYLISNFSPTDSKIYSQTAAAGLAQAAIMHGRILFDATQEAARDAGEKTIGVSAGYERNDIRHTTGSHADIKGNYLVVALGFRADEKTVWGIFGQKFNGDYDAEANGISSNGDLDAHDFGFFVEHRPNGKNENGTGHYYKGIIRAGQIKSDFLGNNGDTTFSMRRDFYGISLGGGYVKAIKQDKTLDCYGHLIYTGLNGNTTIDSINQSVNFKSSNSFRLLTGARLNLNQTKKTNTYLGAAFDYEFSGAGNAYVDGGRVDRANLRGLSGIFEFGLTTKPDATTTISLGLQGYLGKKQGLGGTLIFNKMF